MVSEGLLGLSFWGPRQRVSWDEVVVVGIDNDDADWVRYWRGNWEGTLFGWRR